ncbi:MAG: site-specific DNA-methyltransferase [Smithella sp.]
MIYIDPPYNTGNDFIYPDNYTESLQTYLEYTGQVDDAGKKFGTNNDTDGRFHSRWMNMMYPRLYLARNLLLDDGSIFISIDEKELNNLRFICNDIFGEECFVALITLLCNPKGRSQDKYFATNNEYIVIYSKSPLPKGSFSILKEEDQIFTEYPEEDEAGKYRLLELRNTHREFGRHNRRNLFYAFYVSPEGEVSLEEEEGAIKVFPIWDDGFEGCWTWDQKKSAKDLSLLIGRKIKDRWKIFRKSYANGSDRMLKTILFDNEFFTERGQKEFNSLFDTKARIFQSPKSPNLISQLIRTSTTKSDIVLDFFAGSGTTAQAVLETNTEEESNRRFILVQLPENCPSDSEAKKAGFSTVSEITKERTRRVIKKLNDSEAGQLLLEAPQDRGFRVFKLSASNFKPWNADLPKNTAALEKQLELHIEHIREGRSQNDILYELLLKSGFPLTTPVESLTLAGKKVFSVAGGKLLICLEPELTMEVIRAMAALKPERVVCLDAGFTGNDQLKTNAVEIFKTQGVPSFKTV